MVVALAGGRRRWPEGVVAVGAAGREAAERERERVLEAGAGKKKGSRFSNPK